MLLKNCSWRTKFYFCLYSLIEVGGGMFFHVFVCKSFMYYLIKVLYLKKNSICRIYYIIIQNHYTIVLYIIIHSFQYSSQKQLHRLVLFLYHSDLADVITKNIKMLLKKLLLKNKISFCVNICPVIEDGKKTMHGFHNRLFVNPLWLWITWLKSLLNIVVFFFCLWESIVNNLKPL